MVADNGRGGGSSRNRSDERDVPRFVVQYVREEGGRGKGVYAAISLLAYFNISRLHVARGKGRLFLPAYRSRSCAF